MKAVNVLMLLYDLLSVLLISFGLNLIPFASPSNLLIASNAALLVQVDPLTVGFLVALGSASAKFIHYLITFFIRDHLREEQKERLGATASKVRRWASLALFVAAATPIPDEPVVIPLGLLKYSPVKFFLAFFAGKLSITIIGAYIGKTSSKLLAPMISPEMLMITSITLTVLITIVLLKIDMENIVNKILKRKAKQDLAHKGQ
jgi:membrane protein DedA with SNARE-associated domain